MCFSSLCRDGLGDTPITDEVFSEFDHSSQRDSTRFNDVRGTSGNAPILWALSQDMPETKENHAFMNAADSLLREHLTEPLVIHDADGALFGTFDCSDWQSVIGDCHSNEVPRAKAG
jgi:hypothetical protein